MESNQNSERSVSRSRKIFIVMALSILCMVAVLYLARGAVYNALYALKLIPIPERFTELYFVNPGALPTSTASGHPISFAFTVVNHEGVTTTYPYTSYFMSPTARKTILASGTVSLADGDAAIIPVSYVSTAAQITGEVVVNLPSLNDQSIDFLLPNAN